MDRREFIAATAGTLIAPTLVSAQQSSAIPRVGYLFSFAPSQGEHLWEACRLGLRELGYVEGRSILLEPRWADGDHERMPALVAELVRLKVDVIVAAATPASRAAKEGAGRIPVVIVAVADPVRVGLVASLARPGGTLTGLSLLTPELSGRRVQMLAEILGKPERLAVLANPDNASYEVFLEETLAAARTLGIRVQTLRARNARDLETAFSDATGGRANGLIVFDDPAIWGLRRQVVALAVRARLPAMYGYSEFVEEGGLISYGPHRPDLYRRTASFVDRILKGARPVDLPIERPTRFELFVNLSAARALGVSIPRPVLLQADRVIE
jgi:putative ABC transport system substrate-binding protein